MFQTTNEYTFFVPSSLKCPCFFSITAVWLYYQAKECSVFINFAEGTKLLVHVCSIESDFHFMEIWTFMLWFGHLFPLTVLWSQAFVAQILLSCRWEASPLWRTAVLHKGLASHRQVRVCVDLPINRKLLGSGNLFWMKVRLHTWEVPQRKGALLNMGVALAVKSRDVWVTNDSSRAGGAETGPYKDHWVTVSCSSSKLLQHQQPLQYRLVDGCGWISTPQSLGLHKTLYIDQ